MHQSLPRVELFAGRLASLVAAAVDDVFEPEVMKTKLKLLTDHSYLLGGVLTSIKEAGISRLFLPDARWWGSV